MAESYREMEARHDELDRQICRQEFADRWAGRGESHVVADPVPAIVRDCANCRYAQGAVVPYWCVAHEKFVFAEGKIGCSGWPWDPRDEAAA